MTHKPLALALASILLWSCAAPPAPRPSVEVPMLVELPGELGAVLAEAMEWEVMALHPSLPDPGEQLEDSFHDFEVLGRARLGSARDRAALAAALNAGIAGNDSVAARCFMPRHGIRAETPSGRVDLVICFQCLQVRVFDGGEEPVQELLTTEDPREIFDAIYGAAGLTIAE